MDWGAEPSQEHPGVLGPAPEDAAVDVVYNDGYAHLRDS
jgi:hypothetical protein